MGKVTGILRASEFSPNSNDRKIMECVAVLLEMHGNEVSLVDENTFATHPGDSSVYFSMARSNAALDVLEMLQEKRKCKVVNRPCGVRRCARPVITRLMQSEHIPVPRSEVFCHLTQIPENALGFPCWVKRGDACSQQKSDVVFVRNKEEWNKTFEDFFQRGIETVVVHEHLEGDIVKFYGVADTPFFYWYYPTLEQTTGKFGLESINGPAQKYPFDAEALRCVVNHLSESASTPVYGGDCIVDSEGNFRIIDFNDWPSFSRCAEDAAVAIVEYIENRV